MIGDEQREYWIEECVPWGGGAVYPEEETGEESPSLVDEEESGSEFIPSGSASE